jgi:hypothetical protein
MPVKSRLPTAARDVRHGQDSSGYRTPRPSRLLALNSGRVADELGRRESRGGTGPTAVQKRSLRVSEPPAPTLTIWAFIGVLTALSVALCSIAAVSADTRALGLVRITTAASPARPPSR